jgi:hypothetical protein
MMKAWEFRRVMVTVLELVVAWVWLWVWGYFQDAA